MFFFQQKDGTIFAWKTSLVCPPLEEECSFVDGNSVYNLQLLTSRTRSWDYKHNKDRYLGLLTSSHWLYVISCVFCCLQFLSFSVCLILLIVFPSLSAFHFFLVYTLLFQIFIFVSMIWLIWTSFCWYSKLSANQSLNNRMHNFLSLRGDFHVKTCHNNLVFNRLCIRQPV